MKLLRLDQLKRLADSGKLAGGNSKARFSASVIAGDHATPAFHVLAGETSMRITISHRIALAPGFLKHPIRAICDAVMAATGFESGDIVLPKISVATWIRPNVVEWAFELPLSTSGKLVIEAVSASNEFVWKHAEGILNAQPLTASVRTFGQPEVTTTKEASSK